VHRVRTVEAQVTILECWYSIEKLQDVLVYRNNNSHHATGVQHCENHTVTIVPIHCKKRDWQTTKTYHHNHQHAVKVYCDYNKLPAVERRSVTPVWTAKHNSQSSTH
jgi:hypothetical protein